MSDMETSELRSLTMELSRIRCTLESVMETLVQLNERMSRLEKPSALEMGKAFQESPIKVTPTKTPFMESGASAVRRHDRLAPGDLARLNKRVSG